MPGEPWPRGPIPIDRALPLLAGLLDALSVLHGHGWLHLDLTPANVLVDGDRVTIIDLGHAMRPGEARSLDRIHGTKGHIAPEIFRRIDGVEPEGDNVSFAADLYAVGLLAVRLVSGEAPPGDADPTSHWWHSGVESALESTQGLDVSAWTWWLDAMTASLPIHRYVDVRQSRRALKSLSRSSIRRSPRFDPTRGLLKCDALGRLSAEARRSVRRGGRRAIRLNGPPGSRRSWLLRRLASMLRLSSQPKCALAWSRGAKGPLVGVALDHHEPIVVFGDEMSEACWDPLRELADREGATTIVYAGDPPPKSWAERGWDEADLPVTPIPMRRMARLARVVGAEIDEGLLITGHPGLIDPDKRRELLPPLADWLESQVGDVGALRAYAAKTILSPRDGTDPPEPIPGGWNRLVRGAPDLAVFLASRLSMPDLSAIEGAGRWESKESLDRGRGRDLSAIAAHARLGDAETARRRFRRAAAWRRKGASRSEELNCLALGLREDLLPPFWHIRKAQLRQKLGHERRPSVDAAETTLDLLPPWSRAAWMLHHRIAYALAATGRSEEAGRRFRLLARVAAAQGLEGRCMRALVASWPWHLDSEAADFDLCRADLRRWKESRGIGDGIEQHPMIRMGELWLRVMECSAAERAGGPDDARSRGTLRREILDFHIDRRKRRCQLADSSILLLAKRLRLSGERASYAALSHYTERFLAAQQPALQLDGIVRAAFWSPGTDSSSSGEILDKGEKALRAARASESDTRRAQLHTALGTLAVKNGRCRYALKCFALASAAADLGLRGQVFHNQTIAAVLAGDELVAKESLLRYRRWSENPLVVSDERDSRMLELLVETLSGPPYREDEIETLVALLPKTVDGDHWQLWRLRIESRLDAGGRALASALDISAPVQPESAALEELIACLAFIRGQARIDCIERQSPFFKNLIAWSATSRLAAACSSAALGEFCLQQGNAVMAKRRFDRAAELFGLLGWKLEVARCEERARLVVASGG
ncbi:MAG: hypothetical protein CME06_05115 [Gemmatimonadetes bacterium]|nr:hypothetical protein [Gemmatimonadota bacterium]